MLGLALAAQKACALAIESPIDTIKFFVDNMAAVRMIADLSPHAAQSSSIIFRKAVDLYLHTVQDAKVEIFWVPGHKGISGNERADRLANEGGAIAPEPLFDRTITWARFMSRERAVRNWGRAWQSGHHSAHVMSSLPGPPTLRLHPFHASFDSSRRIHSRLIQVILGHAFYGGYYERFVPSEDSRCPCKRAQVQSLRHVLLECSLHSAARMKLRKASRYLQLRYLLSSPLGLTATANFLSASSAFSK